MMHETFVASLPGPFMIHARVEEHRFCGQHADGHNSAILNNGPNSQNRAEACLQVLSIVTRNAIYALEWDPTSARPSVDEGRRLWDI